MNAKPAPRVLVHWREAEENAAAWMRYWGFTDARVTGPGSDRGIDVRARQALAQVKLQSNPVGRPTVQNLVGARENDHAKALLFFCNVRYASTAVEYANKMNVALFTYALDGVPTPANRCARRLVASTRAAHVRARKRRRTRWSIVAIVLALGCTAMVADPTSSAGSSTSARVMYAVLAALLWWAGLRGLLGNREDAEPEAEPPPKPPALVTDRSQTQPEPPTATPVSAPVRLRPPEMTSAAPTRARRVGAEYTAAAQPSPAYSSTGDVTWFDYRVQAEDLADAVIALHSLESGTIPAVDDTAQSVTFIPAWVGEYEGLVSLTIHVSPSPDGPDEVVRVRWSTHSTAAPAAAERVAEAAHAAAERANDALAAILGDWVRAG